MIVHKRMMRNQHKVNKDPIFIVLFTKNLANDNVINGLIELGDFQNNKHSIHEGCPNEMAETGGCDDCYSGDTEFDMSHSTHLGNVWNKSYIEWKEATGSPDSEDLVSDEDADEDVISDEDTNED